MTSTGNVTHTQFRYAISGRTGVHKNKRAREIRHSIFLQVCEYYYCDIVHPFLIKRRAIKFFTVRPFFCTSDPMDTVLVRNWEIQGETYNSWDYD
jgi:hypothetical protein